MTASSAGSARRTTVGLVAAAVCVFLIVLLSAWGGKSGFLLPLGSSADGVARKVFWEIRLPRNLAAFLAGAGLSISGTVFQALFRNALATPYTLGIASGAAFGAGLYIQLGFTSVACFGLGLRAAATLGASLSMLLVYGAAGRREGVRAERMLLSGVAVSFTFSGMLLLVQYLTDFSGSFRIVRWLMGSLDVVGFDAVIVLAAMSLLGAALIFPSARALDLLTLGETAALARGLHVRRAEAILFFASSMIVGQIVSVTGPIGFVGMMVPHICRKVVGPHHRVLLPAAFLGGGLFLLLADLPARLLIAPAEIPVGVITSLLGGPFFLMLLFRQKDRER